MTPSECRPGTVVLFAQGHVGVIAKPIEVNGNSSLPAVMLVSGECAYCEDLELAPRFLTRNEYRCGADWTTERAARLTQRTVAIIGYGATPSGNAYYWTTDRKVGWCDTYLAARQAVERACGVERTE
jgi:hypothetical protein